MSTAEIKSNIANNYKIDTSANYMKESGLIDNMLQDMQAYTTQLRRLGLEILANRLKESNVFVKPNADELVAVLRYAI